MQSKHCKIPGKYCKECNYWFEESARFYSWSFGIFIGQLSNYFLEKCFSFNVNKWNESKKTFLMRNSAQIKHHFVKNFMLLYLPPVTYMTSFESAIFFLWNYCLSISFHSWYALQVSFLQFHYVWYRHQSYLYLQRTLKVSSISGFR